MIDFQVISGLVEYDNFIVRVLFFKAILFFLDKTFVCLTCLVTFCAFPPSISLQDWLPISGESPCNRGNYLDKYEVILRRGTWSEKVVDLKASLDRFGDRFPVHLR